MSGIGLDRDGCEDRREAGERDPEEHVQGAHLEAMRVRRKDTLCTPVDAPFRALRRKVRRTSQPVPAMDQNSLISEGTVFPHGGRTGWVCKSGQGDGGSCRAFASSRRLDRICSLSRIRRPPPYFARNAGGVFGGRLPLVLAAVRRLPLRPRSSPRDLRAVRL